MHLRMDRYLGFLIQQQLLWTSSLSLYGLLLVSVEETKETLSFV